MPLRQKLKKAREYMRNKFSSADTSRLPTPTPTNTNSQLNDPARDTEIREQPDNVGVGGSTNPLNRLPTALPIPGSENSPGVDSHSQQPQQPTNTLQGDYLEGTSPRPILPNTSSSENPAVLAVAPGLADTEHLDTGAISVHAERSETYNSEELRPAQIPQETPDVTSTMWKGLKQFSKALESATSLLGPIKAVVGEFVECVDMIELADEAKTEYDALQARLEGLFADLQGYFGQDCSLTMTTSMESLCKSIQEEIEYIRSKQGRSTGVRYLAAKEEAAAIIACYHRIEGHLQRLTLNANLSMWKITQEQATEFRSDRMFSRVDRLPSSLPAWYDSAEGVELKRRECATGTRVDVLANILGWARASGGSAVYWLNGMAGTGKTTIAYSVCTELDSTHKLGASFFCSRLREECRNVNLIFPSIAYQLARFSLPFRSALSAVLEKDPDVHGRAPHIQFDALIAKPLLEVEQTLPGGLVVMIDALDECENKESTSRMLDVLLSKATTLPIKFIVSSRPESEIRDQMDDRAKSRLMLHELDKGEVQADIETYLRVELAPMKPEEAQISALVERAGILFIYAATVVRFIGRDNFRRNPRSRLRTILDASQSHGTTKNEEIDQLYGTILKAALDDRGLEAIERDDMQQVLHTVICAREPLTVGCLSGLLRMEDAECVQAALRPLWSVLHVVGSNELVTTLHTSFPDFMFDPARSKSYHCDPGAHHLKLAECCFERMKRTERQFNICGLESSYLPDDRVPDLQDRLATAIPVDLLYACRFWAEHVNEGNCVSRVTQQLRDFLPTRLLLWMEVLNLRKQMRAGVECMKLIAGWCNQFEGEQELVELAQDSQRFVDAFTSNPVSQSTPHIYLSMLAFWPRSRPIAKHYAAFTQGPVNVEGTALDRRQLALLATWTFETGINAMTISPDGQYVALATDVDLVVVDSSSGKVVLGPLHGHAETIRLIVFSPDGTRILSVCHNYGSPDPIIVGWNSRSGDILLGPLYLVGHTADINHLEFSPDVTRLATFSRDQTIRVWDTTNGDQVLCLNTQGMQHRDWGDWPVIFSPDGTQIAAASVGTLQIWDSRTGDTILGPLALGYSRSNRYQIDFITFSLDQHHIICVGRNESMKHTIRVVNTRSGDMTLEPIRGYRGHLQPMGCSPNGRYIVASLYRSVVVCDTQTGNMVLGPLEAHTGMISSVIFSPNGTRIISGCGDGLMCTWDIQQNNPTPNAISNPPHDITYVKFSSDGTCFASGSEDGTISIWDAHTGGIMLGPVELHAGKIHAIDFLDDCIVSGSHDGTICVFNTQTRDTVLGPFKIPSADWVGRVAYSPNGKLVATESGSEDSSWGDEVNVWDAQSGRRVLGPLTRYELIPSVRFSPDGTHIAGVSIDSGIVVWNALSGEDLTEIIKWNADEIHICSFTYSPNGALVAFGLGDETILLWDTSTAAKARDPLVGHSYVAHSLSFSPDSTRLVSGSDDGTIRIWDVQTGATLFELLHGHVGRISSVEYSPDDTHVLSRSNDGSVRVHDVRTAEERALSGSTSEFGDWVLNKDGWVVDDRSRLLVWVPGDLRRALMWPRTEVMVAPYGYVRLKFDESRMGESWGKYYRSDL